LDDPELGLHPSAIIELASMVKMASQHTQVVLETQSPALFLIYIKISVQNRIKTVQNADYQNVS
jgi:predicted ATPase